MKPLLFQLIVAAHLAPLAPDVPLREPQMAANQSMVVLAFGAQSGIYFRASHDEGKTFSPAVKVAEGEIVPLSRHRGPRIALPRNTIVITAVTGKKAAEGTLYSTGQGVSLNFVEAVRLYRLAAAQEDLEGLTNLASMYLMGRGVERDPTQAFQMFTRAAERGYAVARDNLALMYANGEGVKRDFIQAYLWLGLAAAEIPKAAVVRDALAKEMTPAQLAQARQLVAQKRKSLQAKEGNQP